MAAEGHTQDTIVVVTADHGEAFRERGIEGHARAVYRETTEVPFILSFPFRLEPGVVLESRTRNVDVWPTLLDILGLSHEGPSDGVSVLPQLLASARGLPVPESPPVTSFAYLDQRWGQRVETSWPGLAVVDGPYRYVRSMFDGEETEELFDAARDPAELSDIAAVETERTERMRAIAEAHLALDPAWGDTETREIGEMELNQLRALGYSIPQ
jgi:arylsulfatase A-like enzyme